MQLGKSTSQIVDRTFKHKQIVQGAKQSLTWGALNLILAAVMYLELGYGPMFGILSLLQPILWYTECGLALLFTVNFLWDVVIYLSWTLSDTVVEINPLQRKLMGVKDFDLRFRAPPSPRTDFHNSSTPTPAYSPSSFTGLSSPVSSFHLSAAMGSPCSPYAGNMSAISPLGSTVSPLPPTPSPLAHRNSTPGPSSSPGHASNLSGGYLGASPSFVNLVNDRSGYRSGSVSYTPGKTSPLSVTNTLSPIVPESDASGLRARRTASALKSSPLRSEECITDHKALDQFLVAQQDKDYRRLSASPDISVGGNSSFWNYNRSLTDNTSVLRKYQYQVACRSLQHIKTKDEDNNEPVSYMAEEVWVSQNVHTGDVDRWIENLRKWLSNTILSNLVKEIDSINHTLALIGCEDMQIGEVSISTLKQIATTKAQHVPTLNSVIPFLEVCANQEYLMTRIRELASGGAMSSFKWNGGGTYRGKLWGEHLPTDTAVLFHLLCSYMDARLPPHPKYPDGKTFTTHYVMKSPDKPDLTKKDNLLLYQTKMNPPHMRVILGDDVLNPPKGRNNLFHAILLFLRYIQTKQHGMLGRINLGLSGINILWILEGSPQIVRSTKLASANIFKGFTS